jgi:hypothetical protein
MDLINVSNALEQKTAELDFVRNTSALAFKNYTASAKYCLGDRFAVEEAVRLNNERRTRLCFKIAKNSSRVSARAVLPFQYAKGAVHFKRTGFADVWILLQQDFYVNLRSGKQAKLDPQFPYLQIASNNWTCGAPLEINFADGASVQLLKLPCDKVKVGEDRFGKPFFDAFASVAFTHTHVGFALEQTAYQTPEIGALPLLFASYSFLLIMWFFCVLRSHPREFYEAAPTA